ncbi:MAG TPA: DUF1998 domain-containing protein [Polyangiaceae bacterium]|nr:DUF1998 domain-containing protein [Polyangiaceae bacterium]
MAARYSKGDHPPPDGKVRRSQALTTYGPGAMVDLLHDAVLVGGLEFWGAKGQHRFDEPRLRQRLQRQFPHLRDEKPFVAPPDGDERNPTRASGIQVLEFPAWFVCQNRECRKLVRCGPGTKTRAHRYVHDECNAHLVPVRFVMACINGHIEEFPWSQFAHGATAGEQRCQSQDLKLHEGPTGDFSEIVVVCLGCNARRPLVAATGEGANRFPCHGHQPWLNEKVECEGKKTLRLLVRTASNSYFAEVVSSLDIPDPPSAAGAVHEHWGTLAVANEESLRFFRTVPHIGAALRDFSDAQVLSAIRDKAEKRTEKLEEPRTAEFKRLVSAEPEQAGDYPPERARFFARTHVPKASHPAGIQRVVLAHRLREVRVQTGFTRFEARTPDLQGEYPEESLGVKLAPLASNVRWLPGIEVLGEGFFVQLDEKAVRAWEDRQEVRERVAMLAAGHAAWGKTLELREKKPPPFYGPRLYLLHSLAHLLIQAVALECGYSASAIRERIYCADRKAPTPMAGVLFSTGTTGSEGTLGGLLEQGRAVRAHLARAFDQGLCSNDPVCASHDPGNDPTERYLEGAACHGCLFIAEPSCEHFNRFLDRALVGPTLGHEGAAFFQKRP